MNRVDLMGIRIDAVTWPELKTRMLELARTRRGAVAGNVNAHAMVLARRDPEFRAFFDACDIVFCDGIGVKLAARLRGRRIPERMTYPDIILDFARACARLGLSWYLLGARPGVAEKAAERLRERVPDLNICGWHHGYFDHACDSPDNEAVISHIHQARPDVLFVCLGMPLQEKWIRANRSRLDAGLILPAGALLDYVAGRIRRAPKWMTDHGFEWLGRLILEPRRLWRRYLIELPLFFVDVALDALRSPRSKTRKDAP